MSATVRKAILLFNDLLKFSVKKGVVLLETSKSRAKNYRPEVDGFSAIAVGLAN